MLFAEQVEWQDGVAAEVLDGGPLEVSAYKKASERVNPLRRLP
jgi:hypothetical protein